MNTELIKEGCVLLVAGMGFVFAFLAVLVVVTNFASKIVARFSYILPDDEPKKKAPVKKATSDDDAIALAIAVARAR